MHAMSDLIAEDMEAVARIDAVPSILEIACRITGLRFAAVARVTSTSWTACAVRDEIAFGLEVGGSLDLKTTICDEIRDSGTGVIIDHVALDPIFHNHHTPRLYGFESYISIPIFRRDGSFFGTLCALDPLPAKLSDPGIVATFENFARLIGLQLDLQDDLHRKEQELANADRSALIRERFIAILGHDLRNPLAAVVSGMRLLARMDPSPRAALVIEKMGQSTRRIEMLIDDLLDFARGRLGDGVFLDLQTTDSLEAPVREVIEELQIVHPEASIDVILDLEEPIICDISRISQLLSNLVGNALVHGTPNRPITVHARSGQGRFSLSIANEGGPIAPELVPTLFEPFTMANGNERGNGLGLGLFIVSEIAKAHGGTVHVSSDRNLTVFELSMPSGS
ncbi:MAG: GAF domain-containing protein [Novosphingobium sp.]|uniref:GAF domain-containing sensor histidine kinase n=1 Tax=Novosphingobium sp. TaxID=1874826 RepID=UPI0012D12A7D|nr:ATP-binding protein [Novosphingobium sp.]MPS67967.1 GAF domain-containing protein [Novosphingobium sp.]